MNNNTYVVFKKDGFTYGKGRFQKNDTFPLGVLQHLFCISLRYTASYELFPSTLYLTPMRFMSWIIIEPGIGRF